MLSSSFDLIFPSHSVVKGATENATHVRCPNPSPSPPLTLCRTQYSTLLGPLVPPTPLWSKLLDLVPTEQPISITIDNSSIFIPGTGGPQNGFRRTEFIAQTQDNHTAFDASSERGVTVYHFSILRDDVHPLNYDHEYQIVFIEPNDGSHVFGIQLGALRRFLLSIRAKR